MSILDLSLTYHWFDMIASGVKREEYREVKPYYIKRLSKHYDAVRFHRGQGSPVTMLVEIKSIWIGRGFPEWGAPGDRDVYIILLGRILSKEGVL